MDISQRFQRWYKEPIETLIAKDEHTAFAVLTLTLPILERYTRHKVQVSTRTLTAAFFDELVRMFPDLQNSTNARQFWDSYRNGLLHQSSRFVSGDLKESCFLWTIDLGCRAGNECLQYGGHVHVPRQRRNGVDDQG